MKSIGNRPSTALATGIAFVIFISFSLRAADGTWNSLTSGNWSDPANWASGVVADGEGAVASLSANFTTPITITLDSNWTIGGLTYNDSGGNPDIDNLTISHPTSILTLDAILGSPDISITGTNVLILDVVLAGDEGLDVGETSNNNNSRVYLSKRATFTGDVMLQRGRLYLNAGDNTLPADSVVTLFHTGTGNARFCLNGTTQEVAGLNGDNSSRRIYNDNPTPATLIINVPAGNSHDFSAARLGSGDATPDENNFRVIKEGAGIQTLNAANAYSGETLINNGILDVNNNGGTLGDLSAGTTVNPGGTLQIRGTDAVFSEALTLKGTGFGGTNGALLIAGGGGGAGTGPTWAGTITLAANATINTIADLTASGGIFDYSGGFALTKNGPGALEIGSAFLPGACTVNEGRLSLATYASLGGLSLAGGTTLEITNQATLNSLTFSGGSAVVNLYYGTIGANPTVPAITDSSFAGNVALANNATVTLNIFGSGFTTTGGTPIPLIDYGTKTGGGTFDLGELPPGVVGTLSDNGSAISLNISAVVNRLTWFGGVSADWDLTTLNWNGGASLYQETSGVGDIVTFDDTLSPSPLNNNVNLTTAVSPAVINVANSVYPYRFSGTGKISGGARLNKSGFGSLTIATANDFTDRTEILDGAVLIANDAALGGGTIILNKPGNLGFPVLSSDSTTPRTLANGLSFAGDATVGDWVNKGALTFTGLVSFGAGGLRNVTFNSDVTWSGPVSLGGINKLGTNTLLLTGASADLTEVLEVREGTVILDGIAVTNLDTIRTDAQAGPNAVARLILRNGASITTLGTGNNPRVGYDSNSAGTNIIDCAGTWRVPNASEGNGLLHLERAQSLYAEFNLLPGGDIEVREVVTDGNSPGVVRFNFNGGILRARNDTPTFMEGLDFAFVQSGGAIINTEGYNVTIAQALLADGPGGLTKEGAGTLTLTGSNTFTGNIVVNAGSLVISSATTGNGGVTVADGALLGLQSANAGQTVMFPAATVGTSAGATLECGFFNQSGVPPAPAAFVTDLTLNGTTTVNVSALAGPAANDIVPLIGYNTLSGSPTLVTGSLPKGVVGTVTNNTATRQIELVISSIAPLLWTGAGGALWDVASSTNWSVAGVPDVFDQGASVRFDDTGLQQNVFLVEALAPAEVVVSNDAVAYTFTTSGGALEGGSAIIKEGTNSLTLGGPHSFSGTVTVRAGTLQVNNNSSLGSIAGGTIVESGATLDLNAAPGLEPITVSGDGVGGVGALYRSGAAGDDTLRSVTLVGDTSFGSAGDRWDLNTQAEDDLGLKGNGFKLTKVGPGQVNIVGIASATNIWDTDLGDIEVKEGTLVFARRITMGQPGKSALVHSNATLQFYGTAAIDVLGQTNVMMKNVFLTNATFTCNGAANTEPVIFGGPIQVNGDCAVNAGANNGTTLTGVISGSGSVQKGWAWELTLTAANTYSGDTIINNGTLALAPSGSINNSPTILVTGGTTFDVSQVIGYTLGTGQTLAGFGTVNGSVLANGTVSPGSDSIGTLTFLLDLTLAGTTIMELTRDGGLTNDVVSAGALTYGGTLQLEVTGATPLQVDDTFPLFSFLSAPVGSFGSILVPPGYTFDTTSLGVDGTVRVTGVPPTLPTDPTNFTYSVSGGQITLTWPENYTGWYLQVQTNPLSIGLSDNWMTLTNSSGTNSVAFPVDVANPTVFYRMSLQP